MMLARAERRKKELRDMALHACWIINGTGMRDTAVKVEDLVSFDEALTDQSLSANVKQEDVQKIIQDMAKDNKRHAWTFISDDVLKDK